jgi:hypothetical protein
MYGLTLHACKDAGNSRHTLWVEQEPNKQIYSNCFISESDIDIMQCSACLQDDGNSRHTMWVEHEP